MIPLVFHVWQSYLLFSNAYEVFNTIHKHFTFGNHSCSLTSINTYRFFVWQTYFLFLIYANMFWNYTHVYIYKIPMPMKCQFDSLKFFVSHICSLHIWSHQYSMFGTHIFYANTYKVFTVIHKDVILKLYTHAYIFTKYYVHDTLSWKPQIFYICIPYLFLNFYDALHITCLVVMFLFVFEMPMNFYCNS